MNIYDDKLEELLLAKDFAALSAAERSYVARTFGDEAAYAAQRTLRLRSRTVLAAETAPADPNGLVNVMARVGAGAQAHTSIYRIPLWQAAAAALLLATLAWWGRGQALPDTPADAALFATADTVVREVRVVDTIYLPSPQATTHPLKVKQKTSPRKQVRRTPKPDRMAVPSKLAAAMELMPDPGDASRGSGSPQAAGFRPDRQTAISDGTSIRN